MPKAWDSKAVHQQAVAVFGPERATYLEREAHHGNTVVVDVLSAPGCEYARMADGTELCWHNGAWRPI